VSLQVSIAFVMFSRRGFLSLLSWGAASLSSGWLSSVLDSRETTPNPGGAAGGEEKQVRTSNGQSDYYVSNLVDADLRRWRSRVEGKDVHLFWKTQYERNVRQFVIQHRRVSETDTQPSWSEVGVVDAQGTTARTTKYRHVVPNPESGAHRFRLKQVNEEGRTETTDSIAARIGGFLTWEGNDTAQGIALRWQTIFLERPPKEFIVEQKPFGKEETDWRVLGTVEGKGDPVGPTSYQYVVDELPPGGHHFRLKRVDQEGTVTYTDPVSVRANGILEWTGKETPDGIALRWRTAFATPEDTFVVEHRREHGKNGDGDSHWKTIEQLTEEDGNNPKQYRYVATDLVPGKHRFRLKRVRGSGEMTHTEPITVHRSMETAVRMTPPSPNPVRNQATFAFAVRTAQRVTITVYDVMGREVRTLYRGTPPAEENQTVRLQGRELSSGIYFVRLVAGDHVKTRRVTVVR